MKIAMSKKGEKRLIGAKKFMLTVHLSTVGFSPQAGAVENSVESVENYDIG